MSPRISVLIACYNAAQFIDQTLKSLCAQTFRDFEVVIVDDGSTDASAQIAQTFDGLPIQVVQQDNQGAAAARNRAFAQSRGEYVLFLDADDVISPKHLEALYARVDGLRDCVALSKWDRFRTSPEEARFPERPTERDLWGPDWLALDWRDARPMTQSAMLLVPRIMVDAYGGWDERLTLNDDFEFFARIIAKARSVLFAPEAKLYYRSGVRGSLSSLRSDTAVASAFLSADRGTRHLLQVNNNANTRRVCANILQDLHYAYYPQYPELRARALARVRDLGGADIQPQGPPGFHRLRRIVGWQAARRIQRALGR